MATTGCRLAASYASPRQFLPVLVWSVDSSSLAFSKRVWAAGTRAALDGLGISTVGKDQLDPVPKIPYPLLTVQCGMMGANMLKFDVSTETVWETGF